MVIAEQESGLLVFNHEIQPLMSDVFRFAYHFTGNSEDANDLTQETMLRAFRAISSYQQGTNARAWLHKITKNLYINKYRRAQRQPKMVNFDEMPDTTQGLMDTSRAQAYDLRYELFEQAIGDEVREALNSLPPTFREVVVMADLQDYRYEEISDILGVNLNTVRTRIRRGREKMADHLETYATSQGYTNHRFNK